MFGSMKLSASGMMTERQRLEIISQNVANVNNTEKINGEPYRRKIALLEEDKKANEFKELINGVRIKKVVEDNKTDFNAVYDPNHPDAIKEGEMKGYVLYPNVDIAKEMMDALNAQRGFEVNSKLFSTSKQIIETALTIGK